MRRYSGIPEMLLGLVLMACALGYAVMNTREEASAGEYSRAVMMQLRPARTASVQLDEPLQPLAEPETPALPGEPAALPEFERFPQVEMPVAVIDGESYIGTVEIPSLGLSLPVMSEWSYPRLKKAPCRYSGSAYSDDLVIAAHNYKTHFHSLSQLQPGDEVLFTDADGNVFVYTAMVMEQLQPNQVEAMRRSGYALSLFTCAPGGKTRVTVRCTLKQTKYAEN